MDLYRWVSKYKAFYPREGVFQSSIKMLRIFLSYFGSGNSPLGHGTTKDHAYMDFCKFRRRFVANFCHFYGHEERKKKRAMLPRDNSKHELRFATATCAH